MNKSVVSRSFSTKFEDHKALIHSFARKGFGRISAICSDMEYEDVFQSMCVSYTKAASKWDSEKGVSFTAYMGRAIWNDFNKQVEQIVKTRSSLQLVNYEDFSSGEDDSPLERIEIDGGHIDNSPELALEQKQHAREVISLLSTPAKMIVRELISPSAKVVDAYRAMRAHAQFAESVGESVKGVDENSVRIIAKCLNLSDDSVSSIKKEFKRKLGVTFR